MKYCSIFKIRDYLYIYIKLKDKSSYDKIDIKKENEFESFFTNIKNIAVKENSKEKFKKKIKNEEYRKSLFSLQNLLIKFCPNFINSIKLYFKSHIKFNNYLKKYNFTPSIKIQTKKNGEQNYITSKFCFFTFLSLIYLKLFMREERTIIRHT